MVTTGKLGSEKQYVGAFASGFVEGAVGAATLGIGSIVAKVAIDAATSFGSNLIEQKITTGKVSLKKVAVETATGMAISGAASKVAKKFQNSKINQKLTKKLDDVTSSLRSKTKNITTNIAKKTKEATQKAVNTVSDKAKTIANKTLKGSNLLKKGIKNYFSSKKKGAVRLDVLLPTNLFGKETKDNIEEITTNIKKYKVVEFTGSVKVGGEIKDVSRRVYQSEDIDCFFKGDDGLTNLERAKLGNSPIDSSGRKFELHHLLQIESGPMIELSYSKHQETYYNILHGLNIKSEYPKLVKLGKLGGSINKTLDEIKKIRKIRSIAKRVSFRSDEKLNKQYNNFRIAYWKWRANQIEKN